MSREPEMTLRFLAAPTDTGYSGSVDGGRVLEWIDKAAYALAASWSGRYCVTAYVGHVRFTRPVVAGHLVEVTARLVHTGRSSMHIETDGALGCADRRRACSSPRAASSSSSRSTRTAARSRCPSSRHAATTTARPRPYAVRRIDLRAASRRRWPHSATPTPAPHRARCCGSSPRPPT